ncbi:hypothetical protein WJN01_04330 [Flavobacteriaceae bacterium SZ-1-7]|uniref:hypothetical protein n=1 Tax=Tamlana sedimenti TaxID=3134126 RepID=UPI0031288506
MKKNTLLWAVYLFATIFSCNVENLQLSQTDQQAISESKKPNKNKDVPVYEGDTTVEEDYYDHCKTVNLIAGQNHIAGTVNIDVEGDNLIVTFITNADWTIDATHLHITNCADEAFPTTGSGNPKVGNFEYSSVHENGVTEVTYIIDLYADEISIYNEFCFAAHAEVSGPSAETAWAEGEDFGGNSWAMFVEADLSDCDGGFVGG